LALYSEYKPIFKKIILYLLITLVPSLAFSYYLAQHHSKDIENQKKVIAQNYANLHAMNIENFLGETIGRLEMLASSIKIQNSNLLNIETILKETQSKDSRFSGFYLASPSGNLLISTNQTSSLVILKHSAGKL
jgi:two-component system, sporulation sensor kinase D